MESDSLPSLNARLKSIGIKDAYASHLATGKRTPSLPLALEIEAKLGIAPAFWAGLKAAADAARADQAPAATAPGCPA